MSHSAQATKGGEIIKLISNPKENLLYKLPEVKHFIKERKGNQPRLRK